MVQQTCGTGGWWRLQVAPGGHRRCAVPAARQATPASASQRQPAPATRRAAATAGPAAEHQKCPLPRFCARCGVAALALSALQGRRPLNTRGLLHLQTRRARHATCTGALGPCSIFLLFTFTKSCALRQWRVWRAPRGSAALNGRARRARCAPCVCKLSHTAARPLRAALPLLYPALVRAAYGSTQTVAHFVQRAGAAPTRTETLCPLSVAPPSFDLLPPAQACLPSIAVQPRTM